MFANSKNRIELSRAPSSNPASTSTVDHHITDLPHSPPPSSSRLRGLSRKLHHLRVYSSKRDPVMPATPISSQSSTTPRTPLSPISPSVLLSLTPPSLLDIWVLCQHTGFMHDFFIDRLTAITIESTRAKVLLKNIMFKISEEALIIAKEFADMMHQYTSQLDLGQRRVSAHWSIENVPSFQKLKTFLNGSSRAIFGNRIGKRLDNHEIYRPPYVAASRSSSNPQLQGIPLDVNETLVRGIEYNISDWNAAINKFIWEFDPYRPPKAIRQMIDTANTLRKSANTVIKLAEHHYRIALGLKPIEGIPEAETIYKTMVKEEGTDLQGEVRAKLHRLAWATEKRLTARQHR